MKIFKYVIDGLGNTWFELELEQGAEFLSLQMQSSNICVWFKVDENADLCKREFIFVGTGMDFEELRIDPTDKYLGTVLAGIFVWHLFERSKI